MRGQNLPEWAADMTSALDEKFGTEILELAPERVVGRAPVEGNTQIVGIWHGGASGILVESLASMGANAHARRLGRMAVGVDLNVTHHRAVSEGHVTGVATPLHLGGQVATYQVELRDDRERLVATGRLTCQLVAQR